MKKLLVLLVAVLLLVPIVSAHGEFDEYATGTSAEQQKDKPIAQCPITKMVESCFTCHTSPRFKVKESPPYEGYSFPHGFSFFKDTDGSTKGYYYLTSIYGDSIKSVFDYLRQYPEIKYIIFEVQSPGGGMFEAWRIVGLMREAEKNRGYTIETRVHGFAASAGFLIFASGTRGYRIASPHAELMWHELITFKMFDISGPSDKEDEANVLRHLQDTANSWLQEHSNLTKQEIDEKIRKKEFWMNGRQALELGFADKIF